MVFAIYINTSNVMAAAIQRTVEKFLGLFFGICASKESAVEMVSRAYWSH